LKLEITQHPLSGFMGGPHIVSFSVPLNKAKYEIRIKQQGKREISIYSEDGCYDDLLFVYYALETLLMLCDGQFYPVTRAFDGTDITSSFVERKLPSHTSADFMVSAAAKLLEFDTVLNESVFLKWVELSEKLDLIHKMVMYCLSAVEMPKDMQCAYMVEAFKGVCELVHNQKPSFEIFGNGRELNLKTAFLAIADKYGSEIFAEEYSRNRDQFAQILVDTRNRIAHIKSRNGRRVLDGSESVAYIIKMSFLYRIVLFDLLDIPQNNYDQALKMHIRKIDETETVKQFIACLKENKPVQVDKDLESDIYNLLYDFVYSVAIYRSIHSRSGDHYDPRITKEHFWISISDNCIQQAVVDWCKVFGSNNERTHYSKIHPCLVADFEQAVKEEGIDFSQYSKDMKNFRDTFISHRDEKKRRKPIPDLDPAVIICDLYDQIVLCAEPNRLPFEFADFFIKSKAEVLQYLDLLGIDSVVG